MRFGRYEIDFSFTKNLMSEKVKWRLLLIGTLAVLLVIKIISVIMPYIFFLVLMCGLICFISKPFKEMVGSALGGFVRRK